MKSCLKNDRLLASMKAFYSPLFAKTRSSIRSLKYVFSLPNIKYRFKRRLLSSELFDAFPFYLEKYLKLIIDLTTMF